MLGVMRKKRFWFAAALGLGIFFYTLKQADWKRLAENFQHIDVEWSLMALLASIVSYLCIAAVLHLLLRGVGFVLPFYTSFRIALVSSTLNYVMAFGGISGVAAKVYLLSKEKVPPSNTLSISMVHGLLTNTVAVLFVYLGFFYLYSHYKLNSREMKVGIIILLVTFLLTWVTIQIIVHESFRKRLWQVLMRIAGTICRKLHHPRWFHNDRAQAFFDNFNESMNLIVRNYRTLGFPAGYALLDWLAMFLCLKWSFVAVNYPVDNHTLMVGFSIGIFAGLFSLTPASIGVMEGSMAGVFYLMGLDFERSLLATLIYRLSYFFLPILASLFFYKHFFPSSEEELDLDRASRR